MTITDWEKAPSDWDRLTLGGHIMPGVWDVDFPSTRNMDVKKAKGRDGANFKDEGYDPARIELIGKLTTRYFRELVEILDDFNTMKGGKRATYGIDHPKTRMLGITLVYIIELRTPKIDRGLMTMTIRALQHVDKPKEVKKPAAKPVTLENELRDGAIMSIPDGPDAMSKGP